MPIRKGHATEARSTAQPERDEIHKPTLWGFINSLGPLAGETDGKNARLHQPLWTVRDWGMIPTGALLNSLDSQGVLPHGRNDNSHCWARTLAR